jgi:hypothetical protein
MKIAALLAALVLAGCTTAVQPGEPPAPLPLDVSASTPPDSLAGAILQRCRGATACTERLLASSLEPAGLGTVMRALDLLAERDSGLRSASHGIAHGLGIAAYRSRETVSELFASCPNSQIGGCYHGVIQGYFLEVGGQGGELTSADLDALCAPHRARQTLYFQCAHGIGHGVMALRQNQLPRALADCDLITEPHARDSCYGGVFMENVVAEAHPHNTAQAHATLNSGGDAGHAGHGAQAAGGEHAHHEPAERWKPLDATDPRYPCSVVGERYQRQCWLFQTSAILATNQGSLQGAARACSLAPQEMIPVCFRSLGRDITAFASRLPERTASLCAAHASDANQLECIRGAAESLVNVNEEPADGFAFCRVVEGEAQKAACYRTVGNTLPALVAELERRAVICAQSEPEFVARCREGAFLPPERPSTAR